MTLEYEGEDALELPNRPCVLVVEDEALIACALEERLLESGANVVGPFASAKAALEALDGGAQVDAAILDIKLGDDDAFEIAERLASMGVPFGFSTGCSEEAIPPRYRDAPVWVKPSYDGDIVAWLAGLAKVGA